MGTRIASPDFIGRETELERLADAFAAAADRRPSIVIVGGEAGIGKTRLVSEATEAVTARGAVVLVGGTVDLGDTPLPYGPIVEALRGYVRLAGEAVVAELIEAPSTEVLAHLLPEIALAPEASPVSLLRPEWLQARTFEAILALLASLGERQPVVLVIEDLQWADRSTRDLIAFLVRNLGDSRLLIVATFRSDDLHRRHPLVPWLAELERKARVERLDIERFDREEQAAQLGSILGRLPGAALVDGIFDRSDGNPFFTEELLASSAASRTAAGVDGTFGAMPESLAGILVARVATLSGAAQRILGIASVAGRSVGHDLLAAVSSTDDLELDNGLHEALASHVLIREHPSGLYGFRHALTREAVYDDLLESERRRFHGRYAEVLSAIPPRPGADGARHLGELAHHWASANVLTEALRASIKAADAAQAVFAFPEAARHYERATKLWDVVDSSDRPQGIDNVELCLRAATALGIIGDVRRAVEFAREALRGVQGGSPRRAASIGARMARLEWQAGDLDASIQTSEEAAALLAEDPPSVERAEVLAQLASNYDQRGLVSRAIAVASDAIDNAIAVGATAIEGHARNSKGTSLSFLGYCTEGIELLNEALAIAQAIDDPSEIARAYANLAASLSRCDDHARAIEMSRAGADLARRFGMWGTWGLVHEINLAVELVEVGRWDEATAILKKLEPYLPPGAVQLSHGVVAARLAARKGDADAQVYVDANIAALERMHDVQFTAGAYENKVEAFLYADQPIAAAAAAQDVMRRLPVTDDWGWLSILLALGIAAEAEVAAVARARGDEETVSAARARADTYLQRLTHRESAELPELGDVKRFVAWGAAERRRIDGPPDPESWADVKEAWSAVDRPFYAAYAAFREAEAALEARRPRVQAEAPLRLANKIAARLGARPLVGWIEDLARRGRIDLDDRDPVDAATLAGSAASPKAEDAVDAALDRYGLTPREREILGLIVGGWTNRRIATALFISESTAGVHVSNIIGKLGVVNRVEAASLAARLGVEPPDVADAAASTSPGRAR